MGEKKTGKSKDKVSKASYYQRPGNMTLEQWQIALRRQIVAKEHFGIQEMDAKEYPGYYTVHNPVSRNDYRVVYRGEASEWNYCSCMDFKASRLGTCKHLEAVRLWLEKSGKKAFTGTPPYTSVYLSYRHGREVRLRIGTEHAGEFRALAEPYFTPDGAMCPEAVDTITDFFRDALLVSDTFRWYDDVMDFIMEVRDRKRRELFLAEDSADAVIDALLKVRLYPYQKEGIRFAYRAGKAIIADEMGLGKTVQAIGTAELMRRQGMASTALILCPTSLKYQWKKEIERFTDAQVVVVEGNHFKRRALYEAEPFYKIVSYNSMANDIAILHHLQTDFLIMDEVQRLKNWNTKIAKAARRIKADYAVVLSGTPLENKLEELYSVVQFVDQYCLGPYYKFVADTVVKTSTGKVTGYKGLNAVGEKLRDVLIRRRKKDVALQLPRRMDKVLFVPMTEEQRSIHEECQSQVARLVHKWNRMHFLSEKDRKRLLLCLSQMRMVCDSTFILDQKSRYDTKVDEVVHILSEVFESGDEKVVVFSQWERMARLVAAELDKLGVRYEYLHGGVPSDRRKTLMENFTELPESRVFISTDAGSTGLNLQVASVVINMDLPWNPAVLEQRIARIYRIGQQRNIQVLNLVAPHSIEERMLSTLDFKTSLFEGILDNGEDCVFLENSKLDKIMESISSVVDLSSSDGAEEEPGAVCVGEQEEPSASPDLAAETARGAEPDLFAFASDAAEKESGGQPQVSDAGKLVEQGLSFFGTLAQTLKSPEATSRLVDELVEEDRTTGKTTLRIPVPDKECVADLLRLAGKLLSGLGGEK